MSYNNSNEINITGVVQSIVYQNAENGYCVLDIDVDDTLITAVGVFPACTVGEKLLMTGNWITHPSFGKQFKATAFERQLPKSAADMLRYLSSKVVKGIGPSTARKIVEAFGENTFDVLENEPERLASIKGITLEKANKISENFKKQIFVHEIMIHLSKYSMTPTESICAYKAYGTEVIEKINENPYILCGERIGLRFERADEIAQSLPNTQNSIHRKRAGIIHIIRHNLNNGHTCLPRDRIIAPANDLIGETNNGTELIINELIEDKDIIEEYIEGRSFLFLPREYICERSIADRINVMLQFPPAKGKSTDKEIDEIEYKNGIKFEEKQREAIKTAVEKGMLVLTGGPGTGKTTTLNGILEVFEAQKLRILLAAPTGRAAMRMSEITGREAKTIHRLLEVNWGDNDRQYFSRTIENPLEADAVIVDEMSMVDIHLFAGLIEAIPMNCRLVMVGDHDQLPPVGAGNVLHDIIDSGLLPVVALTQVFRQSMQSLIVSNAHKIVKGGYPELTSTDKDFFFMNRLNTSQALETILDLYSSRLPKAYDYKPMKDIQIICPSRKGELGTVNLNTRLQEKINPLTDDKDSYLSGGRLFIQGDKIMQTKNNYDIIWTRGKETSSGIFNGDIGIIESINRKAKMMKIRFDHRVALYPLENVAELDLAYAITVHKSQGSEFEAVIMPICNMIPQLSYRNLLYTAVTRAKNRIILVGSKYEINQMVDNDKKTKRFSALKHFLSK